MKIYELALDKKEDYDELAEELGLDIEQDAQDLLGGKSPKNMRLVIRKFDDDNREYVAFTEDDFRNLDKSKKDNAKTEEANSPPTFVTKRIVDYLGTASAPPVRSRA